RLRMRGLRVELLEPEYVTAQFDLSMFVEPAAHAMRGRIEYASALFDQETIERMSHSFGWLLEQVAANPLIRLADVDLMDASERHRTLTLWNSTAREFPADRCIHDLVAETAARTPDAVAVEAAGTHLTYAQLDAHANDVASKLLALGAGPEEIVGLCV